MIREQTPHHTTYELHRLPEACGISLDLEIHLNRVSRKIELGSVKNTAFFPARLDLRDVMLVNRDLLSKNAVLNVRQLATSLTPKMAAFLNEVLPCTLRTDAGEETPVSLDEFGAIIARPFEALLLPKLVLDLLMADNGAGKVAVETALRDARLAVLPLTLQAPRPGRGFVSAFSTELSSPDCPQKEEYEQERARVSRAGSEARLCVITREYGKIIFSGTENESPRLIPTAPFDFKLPENPTLIAPRVKFFDRKAVELSSIDANALWVAKGEAWAPIASSEDITVWTAGLSTWKELARRGVWVTGSAEGLGEAEDPGIASLIPNLRWIRLSHTQAPGSSEYPLFPTYELIPLQRIPDLTSYTHFFWRSGSSFHEALKRFPEIRNGWHASGPGHTHQALVKELGLSGRIGIFLSEDDFRSAITLRACSGEVSQDMYV